MWVSLLLSFQCRTSVTHTQTNEQKKTLSNILSKSLRCPHEHRHGAATTSSSHTMKARRSSCIKDTSTKNTHVYCIYLGLPLNVLFDLTILRHFTIHILNSLLYGKQIHHKPSRTSVNTSDIKISEWCLPKSKMDQMLLSYKRRL